MADKKPRPPPHLPPRGRCREVPAAPVGGTIRKSVVCLLCPLAGFRVAPLAPLQTGHFCAGSFKWWRGGEGRWEGVRGGLGSPPFSHGCRGTPSGRWACPCVSAIFSERCSHCAPPPRKQAWNGVQAAPFNLQVPSTWCWRGFCLPNTRTVCGVGVGVDGAALLGCPGSPLHRGRNGAFSAEVGERMGFSLGPKQQRCAVALGGCGAG